MGGMHLFLLIREACILTMWVFAQAPELFTEDGSSGFETDVYALGMVSTFVLMSWRAANSR